MDGWVWHSVDRDQVILHIRTKRAERKPDPTKRHQRYWYLSNIVIYSSINTKSTVRLRKPSTSVSCDAVINISWMDAYHDVPPLICGSHSCRAHKSKIVIRNANNASIHGHLSP